MNFGLVTVARRANVAAARAMIDSARRGGFRGQVHAFVIDLHDDDTSHGDEWKSFLSVVPDPVMARRLAPLGLARLTHSVVPGAVLHALQFHATVAYVAPTVHVLAPLDDLVTTADTRVTLIERPKAGAPNDGRHPNETDLAHARRFLPSIVGANKASTPAIEWWRGAAWAALVRGEDLDTDELLDRLAHRFGVTTPRQPGRFADWYSLGVDVPHDDGFVVRVGGEAIISVDVDGRDEQYPHRLDAHQPLPHRVTLAELPTLSTLLSSRPFPPAADDGPRLDGDLRFDGIMREAYRAQLRDALENDAEMPPNPYDDPSSFVDWLQRSQFPTTTLVSRYLRQVYLSRPDLSRAFPEVPGRDTARFFAWANDHGRDEVPIPEPLLPPTQVAERVRSRVRPATTSVNLVGFLDASLGIGEVARRIGNVLDAADIAYVPVPFARERHQRVAFDPRLAPHDINLVCINPDTLASFAEHVGQSFFADRYTIGVWFWETEELPPSMAWAFDLVDEVWAASDFVVSAVAARADGRALLWKFPLAIVAPTIDPTLDRARLGLPADRFLFLASFDYLSVVERKNPIGAIDAFRRAFRVDDGAALVVKSVNGDERADDRARVRYAARGRADIVFIEERLSAQTNASLIAAADCLVSVHRSEGFGFNLADAIALGRPVIATGYGGHLEFMVDLDEWLVPYQMVMVGEGQHPYPADALWADPNLDATAAIMRSVFSDPARARDRAGRAQRQVTERFSLGAAGAAITRHLVEVSSDQPKRERRVLRRR